MKHYLRIFALTLALSYITAQESQTTLAILDFEGRGINSLEAATLTDRFTSEVGKTKAMRLVDRTMVEEILGREVVKLVSEETPAGYQSVIWNTRNSFGQPVSAGIYFYQIQTKGFVKTRKMVLLK
jgi:hypothetical protein